MSDPLEPYEQGSGAFSLAGILSVFQPWRWASEWLLDLWDDWLDRLDWWRESGALRFLKGLILGLVLGAGLTWLWAPLFQPPSDDQVAEGASDSPSVTRSQARRPDGMVEVFPLAGRLQVGEPALTASEAVGSDAVIKPETLLARLEAPEPNPNWQVQVLTGAKPEVLPRPPFPVLATPSNADQAPSLPISAQEVLELPPDLSPTPAEAFAPDLARSAAVPIRSPRDAPVLPVPEASRSQVSSDISTPPAGAPGPALDLSEIELAQPDEGTPEPAASAVEPAPPESSRDFTVAEPVTSAPTIPETVDTAIAGAEPPLLPLRPRVVLPTASQTAAAEHIAPFVRPRSRDEVQATPPPEAVAVVRPVRSEAPQCNIEACTAAYQSFRASDCTYQSFEGLRQLCTR